MSNDFFAPRSSAPYPTVRLIDTTYGGMTFRAAAPCPVCATVISIAESVTTGVFGASGSGLQYMGEHFAYQVRTFAEEFTDHVKGHAGKDLETRLKKTTEALETAEKKLAEIKRLV